MSGNRRKISNLFHEWGAIIMIAVIGLAALVSVCVLRTDLPYAMAEDTRSEVLHAAEKASETSMTLGDGDTITAVGTNNEHLFSLITNADYSKNSIKYKQVIEQQLYGIIPEHIENLLSSRGWTISFVDDDVCHHSIAGLILRIQNPDKNYLGLQTSFPFKTIHVQPDGVYRQLGESRIPLVVLHEVGHAVDCELGYPSAREDFAGVAGSLAKNSTVEWTVLAAENEQEKFAWAFSLYLLKYDELRQECPDVCDYMEQWMG